MFIRQLATMQFICEVTDNLDLSGLEMGRVHFNRQDTSFNQNGDLFSYFSIWKHLLWVLIGSISMRHFKANECPTTYIFDEILLLTSCYTSMHTFLSQ